MQPSKRSSARLGRSAAVPDCPDPSARVPHAKLTASGRRPRAADAPASAAPGSVAMPHGRERRYRTRMGTTSSEPDSHGLFLSEQANRDFSVPVAYEWPRSLPMLHTAYSACSAASQIRSAPGFVAEVLRAPAGGPAAAGPWREDEVVGPGRRLAFPDGVLCQSSWPASRACPRPALGLDRILCPTRVHPILVGLTEEHDQRKGWIARRSSVDP
jgi:hypothetical protein